MGGLNPSAVVIVATVRALKYNGGVAKDKVADHDPEALRRGMVNLAAHVENMQKFGVPVVVAINRFASDTEEELELLCELCDSMGAEFSMSEVFALGGEGGIDLAQKIISACDSPSSFAPIYDLSMPIKDKIEAIARTIYGADGVEYSAAALKDIELINKLGADNMPVCMSKTQYSLSDNPKLLGRPSGFKIHISSITPRMGAEFCVVQTGSVLDMPGLPKRPSAEDIDVVAGQITGLF